MFQNKQEYNGELQELIRRTRSCYFLERKLYCERHGIPNNSYDEGNKLWDIGGKDSRGAVHQPIWPKIVKNALKNNIHPEQLIKGVFLNHRGVPPIPSMFAGSAAITVYNSFKENFTVDLVQEFESFKHLTRKEFWKLKQALSKEDEELWWIVLNSPSLTDSPLYKYLLALELLTANSIKLISFEYQAKMDYLQYPDEYDKTVGKYIPETFKQSARQLRDKLSRY